MSADPADDTPATLAALPDEVLLRLLIFLPPADILRFSVIAKRFRFVAFDNALWRHMYAATYPASFAKHAPRHAADAAWIELVKEAAEVQKRFRTGRPYTHLSLPGPRDRPLGHTGRVFGVALVNSSSADMHTLSAGDDGHLKLWNLDSSKCLASYMPSSDGAEGGLFDVKRDVIYSDRRFLTSTFSGRAQILDLYEPGTVGLETMKVAELKEMLHNGGISSAGCFEKSDLISRIKEFNVDRSTWHFLKRAELGFHMAPVVSVRGYGSTMAFTCSFDGNVHIYDTSALEAPAPVGSKSPLSLSPIAHYSHAAINAANTSAINNVLYDGRFMYSAANDGEIHITDVEMMSNQYGNLPSPRLQRILRGHEHWIWCLEKPTTDQSLLVSGSVDRTLKVWDARADRAMVHSVDVFQGPIAGLSLRRWSENIVVTASFDSTVRILDPRFFGRQQGRSPILAEMRVTNHSNLTRCDIDSDWIVVACQSADVHAWSFRRHSQG